MIVLSRRRCLSVRELLLLLHHAWVLREVGVTELQIIQRSCLRGQAGRYNKGALLSGQAGRYNVRFYAIWPGGPLQQPVYDGQQR